MTRPNDIGLTNARFRLSCRTCGLGQLAEAMGEALLQPDSKMETAFAEFEDIPSDKPVDCDLVDEGGAAPKLISTCGRRHNETTKPNCLRHELLYEQGIHSYFNGDYRAAIMAWFAAYERFLEYWCIAAMRIQAVSKPDFDRTWRSLAKSSERQLGFYRATHLAFCNEAGRALSDEHHATRNRVAHKGHFPAQHEAQEIGDAVGGLVRDLTGVLRAKDTSVLKDLTPGFFAHLFGWTGEWTQTGGGHFLPTFLGRLRARTPTIAVTLEEWIEAMEMSNWSYDADAMRSVLDRERVKGPPLLDDL